MAFSYADDCSPGRTLAFMKAIAFIGIFRTITMAMVALRGSASAVVVTSFASDPAQLPLAIKVLAALFHLITNAFQMCGFWTLNCSLICIAHDMCLILNEHRPSSGSRSTPEPTWNETADFVVKYRAVTVIQGHFASVYMHYMTLLNTSATLSISCSLYIAVALRSGRSLILALAIAFAFSRHLRETSRVYEASTQLIQEWRRVPRGQNPPWFGRFLKSCKPMGVPVGTFFYVDRGLCMTSLYMVANTASTLILAG